MVADQAVEAPAHLRAPVVGLTLGALNGRRLAERGRTSLVGGSPIIATKLPAAVTYPKAL